MFRHHFGPGIIGKIIHLAIVGILVLFVGPIALGLVAALIGVAAGIVALALPFVVIGGLAYGPILLVRHILGYERPRTGLRLARLPLIARRVPPAQRPEPRPVPPVARRFETAPREIPSEHADVVRLKRWSTVKRIAGEVLCGGLVGGVLGAVAVVGMPGEWQPDTLLSYSLLGSGIGAVVGFVVGGSRLAPAEQTPGLA